MEFVGNMAAHQSKIGAWCVRVSINISANYATIAVRVNYATIAQPGLALGLGFCLHTHLQKEVATQQLFFDDEKKDDFESKGPQFLINISANYSGSLSRLSVWLSLIIPPHICEYLQHLSVTHGCRDLASDVDTHTNIHRCAKKLIE